MVDLLENAIIRVRSLPADMQEEVAHVILAYVGDGSVIRLTPEEDAELAEAEAEVDRGELATDEDVAAVLDRFKI